MVTRVRHDRAARRHQARREQLASRSWAATSGTSATTPRTSPRSWTRRPRRCSPTPTRRRSTSSWRTATCSTPWSPSCSRRRPSTRRRSPQIFEPLRRRPVRPAWTGSPDPRAVDDPAGRRTRSPPRNGTVPERGGRDRAHPARWRRRRARRPRRALARTTDRDPPWLSTASARSRGRRSPTSTSPRAEAAVRELLIAVGEDPDREGLRETPARVARAYAELLAGLRLSAEDVLTTTFDVGHDEMVLVNDIELWSMCEHHLVPFTGVAHVGYIPTENGRITGLSKLGPPRRRLRAAPAGAGAADHPGRRRPDRASSRPAASSSSSRPSTSA